MEGDTMAAFEDSLGEVSIEIFFQHLETSPL